MGDSRLLTADQVAERIGMTTDYVYALSRQDRIPHLRFGRTLRYRAEAIDDWLRDSERGSSLRGDK
jgi:excisionase family DNA binding protein